MFLLLIISVQFYFLARVFHKNKLKTVLSVVGLYFLTNFIFAILVTILIASQIIPVDFDFSKPDPTALIEYLNEKNIPIILEIIIFLILGVFYFNYLRTKWTKEVLIKNEVIAQSIKEAAKEVKLKPAFTTNYYCHFHKVNEVNVYLVPILAKEIWNTAYKEMLPQEQIDYMLNMMYNKTVILDNIAKGDYWEVLKADNIPVGYIHYKIEDEKVFLSKIYLKQNPNYKGLGQLMMNHVIDFAIKEGKKSIYLTVNKGNSNAIRFYEKNGFRNVKSETFDIGEGYIMDDYIYQKDL